MLLIFTLRQCHPSYHFPSGAHSSRHFHFYYLSLHTIPLSQLADVVTVTLLETVNLAVTMTVVHPLTQSLTRSPIFSHPHILSLSPAHFLSLFFEFSLLSLFSHSPSHSHCRSSSHSLSLSILLSLSLILLQLLTLPLHPFTLSRFTISLAYTITNPIIFAITLRSKHPVTHTSYHSSSHLPVHCTHSLGPLTITSVSVTHSLIVTHLFTQPITCSPFRS